MSHHLAALNAIRSELALDDSLVAPTGRARPRARADLSFQSTGDTSSP